MPRSSPRGRAASSTGAGRRTVPSRRPIVVLRGGADRVVAMPAEARRADAMLARKLLAEQRFAATTRGREVDPVEREPRGCSSRAGTQQRWHGDRTGGVEFARPAASASNADRHSAGASLTKTSPSSPDQRTHSAMLPPATCAAGAGSSEQPSASARPAAASRSRPHAARPLRFTPSCVPRCVCLVAQHAAETLRIAEAIEHPQDPVHGARVPQAPRPSACRTRCR